MDWDLNNDIESAFSGVMMDEDGVAWTLIGYTSAGEEVYARPLSENKIIDEADMTELYNGWVIE